MKFTQIASTPVAIPRELLWQGLLNLAKIAVAIPEESKQALASSRLGSPILTRTYSYSPSFLTETDSFSIRIDV